MHALPCHAGVPRQRGRPHAGKRAQQLAASPASMPCAASRSPVLGPLEAACGWQDAPALQYPICCRLRWRPRTSPTRPCTRWPRRVSERTTAVHMPRSDGSGRSHGGACQAHSRPSSRPACLPCLPQCTRRWRLPRSAPARPAPSWASTQVPGEGSVQEGAGWLGQAPGAPPPAQRRQDGRTASRSCRWLQRCTVFSPVQTRGRRGRARRSGTCATGASTSQVRRQRRRRLGGAGADV